MLHSWYFLCISMWLFLRAYIGACVYVCVCVCVCECTLMCLTLASRARVCQRGVALSAHLSSLERSHSATPVAVRALCPPQCVALLPSLPLSLPPPLPPPSTSPPPHSCLLSCVHWPSAHSLEHVLFILHSPSSNHTRTLTRRMHTNTVCMPTHLNGYTLKMKSDTHTHTHNYTSHSPMYV